MKTHELATLLPCHGLDDFPFYHEGKTAHHLLACYTALWHPALLARARRMPRCHSAYLGAEQFAHKLVVLPRICRDDLPGYWSDEVRSHGGLVVETEDEQTRDEIVAGAVELLGERPGELATPLVGDFYALGLSHLLVELLTVQMRYTSLIDEEHFSRQLVAAAEASLDGEASTTHERLAACFDLLAQSKNHFYPVEAYLVDLTLVAPTTLGNAFLGELRDEVPRNLLATANVLSKLAERSPESLAMLVEAMRKQKIAVVGGEAVEHEAPLAPPESVLANLRRGLKVYQELLGQRPTIFGRRRFGLSPLLPQILGQSGFSAALHCTLDDGRFPQARQSLARWEGFGGTAIDAFCRVPLDAARPESILTLPQHMSSSMDMDHVAIVAFAHWPGESSHWYRDLQRAAAYTPTIGRFVTLPELFEQAQVQGQLTRFTADEYRSPYLAQQAARGEKNPISRIVRLHQEQASREAEAAFSTIAVLLSDRAQATDPENSGAEKLASLLPHDKSTVGGGAYLVFNPLSFARRVVVPATALKAPPAVDGPIYAAGEMEGRREVVVDVPGMGYASVAAGDKENWHAPRGKPMAERLLLRNELCEVSFDERTGALQSIFTPGHRGNRLSQQLALRKPGPAPEMGQRWREPDESAEYSQMVAEGVEILRSGPATAEMLSHGRLVNAAGAPVATYRQITRLCRGVPIVWLDIELTPLVDLSAEPWQHYFAARFAWPDESAELVRGVGMVAESTQVRRLESPYYVEILGQRGRTTILTGGLPYHRRVGLRALDTLLIVAGESSRQFHMAIGLDLAQPLTAALELLSPPIIVPSTSVPKPASSWFFHVDVQSVVATFWEPRLDGGQAVGLRVRLQETAGRGGRFGLYSYRGVAAARRVDFLGQCRCPLQVEGDKVIIDIAAGEWLELELDWSN